MEVGGDGQAVGGRALGRCEVYLGRCFKRFGNGSDEKVREQVEDEQVFISVTFWSNRSLYFAVSRLPARTQGAPSPSHP